MLAPLRITALSLSLCALAPAASQALEITSLGDGVYQANS